MRNYSIKPQISAIKNVQRFGSIKERKINRKKAVNIDQSIILLLFVFVQWRIIFPRGLFSYRHSRYTKINSRDRFGGKISHRPSVLLNEMFVQDLYRTV